MTAGQIELLFIVIMVAMEEKIRAGIGLCNGRLINVEIKMTTSVLTFTPNLAVRY